MAHPVHRGQRELGYADDRVLAEAGADCRDVRGEASLKGRGDSGGRETEGSSACLMGGV